MYIHIYNGTPSANNILICSCACARFLLTCRDFERTVRNSNFMREALLAPNRSIMTRSIAMARKSHANAGGFTCHSAPYASPREGAGEGGERERNRDSAMKREKTVMIQL